MEDKKTFGEYVTKRRKEMGFTQREFAEKLFVTESAVSKWERGISYPDITLIREICEILGISEHELLTASDDIKGRNSEKMAKKYERIVQAYRNILMVLYGIPLAACFIVNIAVSHKLTWFFIVLASEMIAVSLTLVPVMVPVKKALITLGAFTFSLSLLLLICNLYTGGNWFIISFISVIFGLSLLFLPLILRGTYLIPILSDKKTLIYFTTETLLLFLLLFVCNQFTGGNWFLNRGMPIAGFSCILPWGIMLIMRYAPINIYFKFSGCFALASLFEYTVQGFLHFILNDGESSMGFQYDLLNWNSLTTSGNINMIIFLSLLFFSIIFLITGIIGSLRETNPHNVN